MTSQHLKRPILSELLMVSRRSCWEDPVSSLGPITCTRRAPYEVIKILKGNLRLRKSQFEEIFWKAVWPRLLAKGWHSERVKDHKTLGLDQSLVFLVYDVHKFSSTLVKGEQYFDSVTDVLNKVASEPTILGSQRKQALEPGRKKFTVMDTSAMLDEAKSLKFRKVRNLPAQTTSVDNVEISSEKSEDNAENISGNGTFHDSTNGLEPVMEAMKDQESPAKKHLISGMNNLTTISSLGKGDNRDGSDGGIVHDARLDGEVTSVKSPPQKHTFGLNIPYVSPETETDMTQNSYGSREKRIPIDLNIPCIDKLQNNGDSDMKKSSSPSQETRQNIPRTLNLLADNVTSEDNQPVLDSRRKGIRERPMTKRALEALEDEFSNTRTWKRVKVPSQKNSKA
ncbi:hypothetical protein L484_009059 [Morus notabilis]|uniref:DUF7650 domain-containing protein n=1 Tax=Morus notabilis TaxID=981085 RepID=W9QLP7_9ROSA|nr:hypothetical protein L484_009059 [Morus notabilis]